MKRHMALLELSKKEIDAVVQHIFPHVRAYPESTGFKTWAKMWDFVNEEQNAHERRKEEKEARRKENLPIELDFE